MQLDELYDYKNKLMEDILTNETIVSLINEEVAFEDAVDLAYKQVFPYEYVPETIQDGHTYICFDVDILRSMNKTFYMPTIYVWVFTHRSRLRAPGGGVRPDKICSEICKTINGSRYYGLGELDLYSVKRFAPLTDYQGHCMTFYAQDFNRVYDPNKPTPSNRKTG